MLTSRTLRRMALTAIFAALAFTISPCRLQGQPPETTVSKLRLEEIPFDGRQAFAYLQQLCSIGPRPSGSAGMAAQQKLLKDHFFRLGGIVSVQDFGAYSPIDQNVLPMTNIIVQV